MERNEEKIFDVVVFSWEEWDEIDINYLQFYNIEFPYESMKKYNGMVASLDMNGEITIYSSDGECKELWKGFAIDIPEFNEELMKKYAK